MAEDLKIAEVIGDWQRKLLQLDRRNNLLYFKPGRRSVQILNTSPDEIDDRLQAARVGLRFDYAERVRRPRGTLFDSTVSSAKDQEIRVSPGDLDVDVEPLDLQRRLGNLHRKDREWEEEQGLNVLFLAVGFLNWIDEDGQEARSPLVLLPCDLIRASPRDPYYLQREDDDAVANATLEHKLGEFGIEVPELGESPPSDHLDAVRRAISGRDGWSVTEDIFLSTFAYSKLAMYGDLDRMRTEGIDHPLVRQLAGGPPETTMSNTAAPQPSALPPDRELAGGGLDDLLAVGDQFAVREADFSQLRAIEAARQGAHLVIHGPPGTGKSQTIANIIATLLAEGKRVLFVSEKTAALDVVKRRLEECDLGTFCLDLHSERGKKSSVYEQLRASLNDPRQIVAPSLSFEDLDDRRRRLNKVVRALHEVRSPLGRTIFQIHGRYAQVQELPRVDFTVADVGDLDADRLARIGTITGRIARREDDFREHETSRWLSLIVERVSVQLPDLLRKDMERVHAAVREFLAGISAQAEWAGSPVPSNAEEAETLREFFEHLSQAESVPTRWLDVGVLSRLRGLANAQAKQQAQRKKLENGLEDLFGEARPDVDYRRIAATVRLSHTDQIALKELLGDEWAQQVVPDPKRCLEQVEALEGAARDLFQQSSEFSGALGGLETGTSRSFHGAVALAERILKLSPVPASWVNPQTIERTRGEVSSARQELDELAAAEERLHTTFSDRIVEVVDDEILVRYRTDYQSLWRRLGGAYRRDQRLLRGQLATPGKLRLQDALRGIEEALKVVRLRRDWDTSAAQLSTTLGDRFTGRDTDWVQVVRDLDEATALAETWNGDRGVLDRLLTERDAAANLRAALSAAVGSESRCTDELDVLDRGDLLQDDQPIAELVEHATRALGPLRELTNATEALVDHFRQPPDDLWELVRLLDDAVRLDEIEREDAGSAPALTLDFGDRFTGPDTDWERMAAALKWSERFLDFVPGRLSDRAVEHATSPAATADYEARAADVRDALLSFTDALRALEERFDPLKTPWAGWIQAPFRELDRWASDLDTNAESASAWIEYQSAVRDIEIEFGPGIVARIRSVTDRAEFVPGIVLRGVYAAWLDHIYESEPALRDFTAKDQADVRAEFRQLDRQLPIAARQRVRERCFERYPDQYSTSTRAGQLGILQGELSKRRRQLPVRKLLTRISQLLQVLKPCMLMSPLAVSQYLPRGELASESIEFDVVIFDEASQIFPEDAVPVIARGRQVIVVGDQHQLPPTSFFRHTIDDDDDPDDDDPSVDSFEGRESILDVMVGMVGRNVAQQYLAVHYRRKHESLIRYSNHYFYDDRLLTFPGPERDATESGIRDVYLPDARYDAGATRTNRGEAERVVDLVFELMRTRPSDESIGVVTLSRPQADLVQQLIEERRLDARDLDDRFAEDKVERFFVKNLENVQGDERDHMIFTIGYGPTVGSGAGPNRFGPINQEGGERRLNVAVSRARRTMTVVHSLLPEHIVAESEGARLLRRYLEFVRDPVGAFESQIAVDPGAETESPFEEAVRRALEQRGHRVDTQIGVAGYRIDLAVRSEDGLRYDLGIECDGATYHRTPAARDRDWLRQQVLEGLGWTIHRVWSTAWIRSPEAEVAAIEEALETARAATTELASPPDDAPEPPPREPVEPETPVQAIGDSKDATSSIAAAPTYFFDEYEQASLADVHVGSQLQHEVRENMNALIRRIVEVEGSVHVDLIQERIRDRYGVRRAGHVIQERIALGVRDAVRAGVVEWDGSGAGDRPDGESSFLVAADDDGHPHPRRPGPRSSPRRVEHIAHSELEAGLLLVAGRMFGAEQDALIVETARQFGFQRTGDNIKLRMEQAIQRLLEQQRLRRQFEMLITGDQA